MRRFADIVGQEHLKEHLENAIKMDKVSHAYIINGEKNAGKEFIAKTFAMALQCENRQGTEPCGECHSCRQALSGNHPDIIFITHEKPGTIGVDDIRRQVNNDVAIKPYKGPKKIYIMNEGEKNDGAGTKCTTENLRGAPGICGTVDSYRKCRFPAADHTEQMRGFEYEARKGCTN